MKLKLCTALLTAVTLFTALSLFAQNAPNPAAAKSAAVEVFGKLPLSFEPSADSASFLARSGGYSVWVSAREVAVVVSDAKAGKSQTLHLGFDHANAASPLQPLEPQEGVTNYYLGEDSAKWRLGVRNYAKVRAQAVYPGVDVIYYGDHRSLEFDFVVAPKADPRAIALSFSGMEKLYKDATGDMVAEVSGRPVRLAKPYAYQRIDGVSKPVAVDFDLASTGSVHLRVGDYDRNAELIIDPVVSYATYLGGAANDVANGIAVDNAGNAYVTGETCSSVFPIGAGATNLVGSCDAFVTKYNAAGTAYAATTTIIGGTHPNPGTVIGYGIALDTPNPNHSILPNQVYITGFANVTDIPLNVNHANGLNTYQGGDSDAFIMVLTADTLTPVRSTYLGGSGADWGLGIAVDVSGNVIVTGTTSSDDFPGYNAFETKIERTVAFVTKLDPNFDIGQEFLNGASAMTPMATGGTPAIFFSEFYAGQPVAPAPTGSWAKNTFFPLYAIIEDNESPGNIQIVTTPGVTGPAIGGTSLIAWNPAVNGTTTDGTVTWINLGPAGVRPPAATTYGYGVALDPIGDVFVAGGTNTANLADFVGPFGPYSYYAGTGSWVLKVSGVDGSYRFATALQTAKTDSSSATIDAARAIAVDTAGRAYVVGTANGALIGTNGTSYKPSANGQDAFLVRMNNSGGSIDYATYLGGSGNEEGLGVAVDTSGAAYVTGDTSSVDFPTINPLTNPNSTPVADAPILTLSGAQDAFIAKFTTDGSALIFSSYLGGSDTDQGNAIAIDTNNQGNMYVAGSTYSADFTQLDPSTYTAPQNNYAGGGDAFVALVAGAGLPTVTVSPGSLSFGTLNVGTASTAVAVKYFNTNLISSVTIESITFGGTDPGDFTQVFPGISSSSPGDCVAGVVDAGAYCNIWVVFTPGAGGPRSATLTIVDGTSTTAHVVTLSGTGAVPQIALAPTSLTFPSQLVNTSSAAQPINLEDTGQGVLVVSSVTLSGTNPGDFSTSNSCSSALTSGSSCTIFVIFKPTTLGLRNATLIVNDNAPGSPHAVALSGTATAVANTITPAGLSLTFGQQSLNTTSATQPITVQDTDATQTLVISGVTVSGDFKISSNTCTGSISPSSSCTIQVAFDPTVVGARTGVLTISGNGSGMPETVSLNGTGVTGGGAGSISISPTSLAFNSVQKGTVSPDQPVTLTNTSATSALTITSIAISGSTDFAVDLTSGSATACGTPPFTLAASAGCTIYVKFAPTALLAESATLAVTSSSSSGSVSLSGTGSSAPSTTADFTLTPDSTGVSVVQGNTAVFNITIAPLNGFNSTINFTCVGPSGSSCSFSPNSQTMDGVTVHTVQLSVGTSGGNGTSAKAAPQGIGSRSIFFALLPFSMVGMLLMNKRRGIWLALILVGLCLVVGMVGCGAGAGIASTSSGSLSPGSYPVTVTAASTGTTPVTHTLALTVNVTAK